MTFMWENSLKKFMMMWEARDQLTLKFKIMNYTFIVLERMKVKNIVTSPYSCVVCIPPAKSLAIK